MPSIIAQISFEKENYRIKTDFWNEFLLYISGRITEIWATRRCTHAFRLCPPPHTPCATGVPPRLQTHGRVVRCPEPRGCPEATPVQLSLELALAHTADPARVRHVEAVRDAMALLPPLRAPGGREPLVTGGPGGCQFADSVGTPPPKETGNAPRWPDFCPPP